LSNLLQQFYVLNRKFRKINTIKVLLFVDGALPQNCFIDCLLLFLIVGQFCNNTSKLFFFLLRILREHFPIPSKYGICPFLLLVCFCFNSSPRFLHFQFTKGINFCLDLLFLLFNQSLNRSKSFFLFFNKKCSSLSDSLLLLLTATLNLSYSFFALLNEQFYGIALSAQFSQFEK
jgi:hypothetical protein